MRAILVFALLAGCDKKPEPSGIGPYTVTRTKLGDVTQGRRMPTVLDDGRNATWISELPGFMIGGARTEVHLYFDGNQDTSKLIEIQLQVRGCEEDVLDRWMSDKFGPTTDRRQNVAGKPDAAFWKSSVMFAVAEFPHEGGRCAVHMVPLSEGAEIARLHAK